MATSSSKVYQQISDNIRARAQGKEPYKPYKIQTSYGSRTVGEQEYLRKVEERRQELEQEKLRKRQEEMKARGYTTPEQQLVYNQIQDAKDYVAAIRRQQMSGKLKSAADSIVTGWNKPGREKAAGISKQVLSDISKNLGLKIQNEQNVINNQGRAEDDPARLRAQEELGKLQDRQTAVWMKQNAAQQGGKKQEIRTLPGTYTKEAKEALHDRDSGRITSQDDYVKWMMQGADAGLLDKDKEKQVRQYAFYYNAPDAKNSREYSEYFRNGIESGIFDEGNDLGMQSTGKLQSDLADFKHRKAQAEHNSKNSDEINADLYKTLGSQGAYKNLEMNGLYDPFTDEYHLKKPGDYNEWDVRDRSGETRELSTYYDSLLYDSIHGEGAYNNILNNGTDAEFDAADAEVQDLWARLENGTIGQLGDQYNDRISELQGAAYGGESNLDREIKKRQDELNRRETIGKYSGMEGAAYNPNLINQETAEKYRTNLMVNQGDAGPQGNKTEWLYWLINNVSGAEHDYGEGFLGELTNVQQAEQSYRKYSFMTDEMIGQFNALYEAGKTKEAQAFMDAIDPYISQMAAGRAEELRYNASKGMFGGLYGAMTILRQPVAGLEGTIGSLAAIFGNEDAKNPNSNWYRLQRMNSTTRGARAETWGDFFANSFGEEYRGAGEWLNGVTYSIADNLMAMALTKGAGKAFGYDMASKSATRVMQFIMSSGAASSTMVQKLNDGMDPTEAAIYAVGNGIIEAITEKYSIEALLKPNVREMLGKPSQILKYIGKNTLAEATEEGASNLLGTTFDQLMSAVFNHESELESQYNQLISQGMSEKDASRQVWNNWGETLLSEMMAGGLSGFFLSSGNVAQNTVRQGKTGAQIRSKGNVIGSKTGADQLIEAAKGMNEGTQSRELAEGISEKAEKGKKASNYELGRLAQNIIEESTEEIGNIAQDTVQRMVEETLKEQGVSPETISIVAPMITQAAVKGNAGILSRTQMAEIAKSKPAIETLRSFVSNAGKVGVNMVTGIAAEKPLAIRQAVADLMKGGKASTTISGVFAGNVAQARKTADIATKEDMEGLKGKARNNGLDAIWNGEIVQITGKSNGKIDILRENGEHESVNADELTAAGEAMATLLNYTNMYKGVLGDNAFSALTAEILNNKDLDGTKFVSEALRAYIGFRTGNPITTSALSDKTMEQIRKAAETAAEEARQARLKAGEAYEKAEPGKGALMFDGAEYGTDAWKQKIKKAGLSHDQRNQAAALGEMIRRLGVRVDLINVDNNDMFGYEDSKGRLYINIGAKDESGSGQHLLTVASHELTHWLEHTSDTGYAELREFVLDQLRKRGANIEAMVASTIDQYRQVVKQDLSIEGALAEIVANACDQVLANENTAKALNEEHPDLYKKVKGFAKNFLERVKAATNYSRESTLNTSVESRMLWNEGKGQKVLDEIARIYMGARQEALSRQEARTGAEGKEPGAQLSIRQLSSQDKAYADAVKRGDIQAATDMLMDKLAESENIIPFNAPNWYAGEHADVAQLIKTGTPEAIARAAASMASYVPDNGVLVPMPNHHGQVNNDTDTMILAKAIGELTNRPVIAALEGADRESRYTSKAAGGKGIQAEEMGFRQVKEIPEGTVPIFVDNVVGSGVTAQAAREAMGGGITLAYAKSVRSKGIEGLKRATVTYDRNGELIPLSQRFNPNVRNINYSVRQAQAEAKQITDTDGNQILNISDTGSVTQYSYRSYITEDQRGKVMRLLKKMGFSEEEIVKWMKDLDEVASIIEADPTRLDYTPDRGQKYKKPNGDVYKWTLDASSLCAKRLLYQGTFNEIQKQLPNTPLRPGDLIDLVNMMHEMGYITPCGICYVESRRRHTGNAIEKFLADYKGDFKPNYADLASTDGLAKLKSEHPDAYKAFIKAMNKRGAGSIKLVQLRTDYRGDLRGMKKDTVNYLNHIGGIRIQSFSDFETPHMLDLMQAVVDMKIKGLKSQAYTKVPNFAWVFGDTGIKINLSLMGEGTGVDKNGKLIFSSTEGMRIDQAMMLRTKYSKNVGTILVGMSVEHIKAAMADPRIDFIIPFHKSGWSAEEFEKMTTLQGYNDFEAWQNERVISGTTASGELTYKNVGTNIEPDEYWDYSEGVTGKQNAQRYLDLCKERGVVPKFDFLLDDNGDGSYSLPEDGSADGYWKLLIDYKMYDNDGHPAKQQVVDTNFNMEEARRILADYKGGADTLPVAEPVVERYVQYYKDKHPLTGGKTQYSVRQLNDAYMRAARTGDIETMDELVKQVARRKGFDTSEIAYHGTNTFGFTEFNMDDMQGQIFVAYNPDMARTYTENSAVKNISEAPETLATDVSRMKPQELVKYAKKLVKKYDKRVYSYDVEDIRYLEDLNMYAIDVGGYSFRVTKGELMQEVNKALMNKGGLYQFYTRPGNQLVVDAEGNFWNEIPFDLYGTKIGGTIDEETFEETDTAWDENYDPNEPHGWIASTRDIARWAEAHGYDSVRINNVADDGMQNADVKRPAMDFDEDIAGFVKGDIAIFFNPNDVKSADTITYEDDGSIIPPSERFSDESNDLRFSIRQDNEGRQLTPEQQEYFKDSKAVDGQGRLKVLYHGAPRAGFNVFKNDDSTFWFTDSKDVAMTYSNNFGEYAPKRGEEMNPEELWLEDSNGDNYVAYLNIKNPAILDAARSSWENVRNPFGTGTLNTDEWAKRAKDFGFDGVIIRNVVDEGDRYWRTIKGTVSTVYAVFSPEQIKSINNTEPTENPDIRFSIRQGDMEINRWMEGLTASSLQTEQERTMLKQWKNTRGSLDLARHALFGYKTELSKLEAKPNPTAYEKHQMIVLRDRIEAWQKKVDRYETSLAKATSEKGFAAIMRKQSRIMNDLVNGRTADEVRGTVDAINAELETVQKEMEARKERLKQLAAKEAVIRIRQQLNSAGLKRIAAKLKSDLNSELSNTEIENRLALMALKMKEGNIDEEDVTELADMLIGKMRRTYDSYILDELRGRTITLSQSQQKELKGQNRTIREIRQELAGTGIRIDTKGGNTLDKNWSELCDLIPALNREAADKDMLDQLLNVIAAEKEAARNQYTANMDMEVASMVIDAASNLVPEIVTDKKSMQLIRETLNFIAEMSTEAEESAKALEELNSLMARLQKKGGEAKSTLGKLESNIHDAIAYNNELSTQSEQANWLTERHKLIDQLKSEHTQEMLRQQAEFKLKIEKDKAARGLMNENMALRRRINTNILRVRNLLMKESMKQNVPEHMKGLAREMLDLIVRNDMSGRKITGMDLKMLQETRRVLDAWEAQDGKYSPDQLKGLDEAVQDAVYNALEDIKAGIDFYNASTKGSELTVNLQAFKNALTRISEGVSEITGIINAERSIALGDRRVAVEDQAYKVQESAGDRRAKVLTGRLGQTITTLRKAITSGNLTPEYFFKMLKNEGLDDLWEEYHRAENRNGLELAKSKAKLDEIAQKHGYKEWDTDARRAVKLESGTVNMTLGQIMSLYATWKREHTLGPAMSQHLQNGGFYVEEYDPREGIIGRREVDLKAHRVTEADMEMVNGLLTDEQKQFVDDIVYYMSTDMSELGNEASMKAYGIRMYKESYYFPFKMWDGIRARASNDSGSAAAANDRAFHPSFSKTRLHGANNALMLGDFMTTAADHIVGMINYATMGLANENLQKVLNAQVPEGERLDQMTRRTIRTVLEEAYGRTMTEYLAKLQEQLNGGAVRVDRTVYDRMLTLFRKNAVAGSMSVALQQPLSYIRAAMMINPKYMTEALAREYWQGSYQERMKHSGISVIKDMGRFDMGFGQGAREYITPDGKEGKIRKAWDAITDKATILPELMDRWTWNRLWVAVKAEQHDLHPDMDVKSDAFLGMVGERFNDIVRKTQVYDSTLTKSQNMRSQNPFVKSITSFMAEPTLSLNVLADAVQNAKEKGGKLKLAKALATFALSAMAQAAAKALMSTGRSPDDKKTWKENYLYRYYANLISEADPMNLIPGYNDLITLLKDGKLEDDAMGVLGKLFTAGDKLAGMFKAGAGYREIEDGAGQIIQLLTQLPAKNIMRDLRAMYNWFIGKPYADRETSAAVIRLQTEASLMTADNLLGVIMAKLGEAGYKVTNSAYYDRMYSAYQRGDQQGAEAIREYLTLGKGVDESQIDSNMRTMTRKGNLFPALEANKAAEIAAAIKDLQEFGAEVKDIKSAITKEMKPKYLAADAAGKVKIRDAIQKAYKAMGLTAADADKVINGWKDE